MILKNICVWGYKPTNITALLRHPVTNESAEAESGPSGPPLRPAVSNGLPSWTVGVAWSQWEHHSTHEKKTPGGFQLVMGDPQARWKVYVM